MDESVAMELFVETFVSYAHFFFVITRRKDYPSIDTYKVNVELGNLIKIKYTYFKENHTSIPFTGEAS